MPNRLGLGTRGPKILMLSVGGSLSLHLLRDFVTEHPRCRKYIGEESPSCCRTDSVRLKKTILCIFHIGESLLKYCIHPSGMSVALATF